MFSVEDLRGKTVVGFGASVAAVSTIAGTDIHPAFFVDGNETLHGGQLGGADIRPPTAIGQWLETNDRDQLFVIVFAWGTLAVSAIFEQLTALSLRYGEHFTDASQLHYSPMAARLRERLNIKPDPQLFEQIHSLAINSSLDNRSSIAGTWLIQQLLRNQLERTPGDIAEAGVYKGGSAVMTLMLGHDRLGEREYHLFDSFAGLPELSPRDPTSRAGEFADASLATLKNHVASFSQARLHVGLFADTFGDVADRQFCLVYIDCDLYEPARYCCEFFYPRLPPNGILLFHDYWVDIDDLPLPEGAAEPFTGIRAAVDEMAAAKGLDVIRFPETTHALIVR